MLLVESGWLGTYHISVASVASKVVYPVGRDNPGGAFLESTRVVSRV